MKKLRYVIAVFFVLFSLIGMEKTVLNVKAADNEAPVLTYIDVRTYVGVDFVAGETMGMTFNVKDPSGISDVIMVYKKVDGEGFLRLKTYSIEGNTDYEVNAFSCRMTIDKYAESGKYRPYLLFIYDGSANKNMAQYIYSYDLECFRHADTKARVTIDERTLEVKQNKSFKITEYNAESFTDDWQSVKKGGTIVVKGSMSNSSASTVLPVEFLKYVKKQNIKVIVPDHCGLSAVVIQGKNLKNSQIKEELKVYVIRQNLTYDVLGKYDDEMYYEIKVKISNRDVPISLWVMLDKDYQEIRGTYPTRFSKIVKNSSGEITKTTTLLKKCKIYADNTIRKNFSDGLGTKNAYFAVSSKNTKHNFDVTVTKKATFTSDGQSKLTCSKCGESFNTIISKVEEPKLSSTSYIYNGKKCTPTVTLTDSAGRKLVKGTDYTVTYEKGRTVVGRYTVTVKLKGKYSGTKKLYFDIKLNPPENVTAKLYGYNDVQLSWDKLDGADGYMIYSYNPTRSDPNKIYELEGSTTKNTYKIYNLEEDVYQFVVKAYVKDGDEKVLSNESNRVTIATMGKVTKVKVKEFGGSEVNISWYRASGATNYQISISADATETNIMATTNSRNCHCRYAPEKGTKMYYKVRGYQVVDGKKIYTPWSKVVEFTFD